MRGLFVQADKVRVRKVVLKRERVGWVNEPSPYKAAGRSYQNEPGGKVGQAHHHGDDGQIEQGQDRKEITGQNCTTHKAQQQQIDGLEASRQKNEGSPRKPTCQARWVQLGILPPPPDSHRGACSEKPVKATKKESEARRSRLQKTRTGESVEYRL